MNIVVFRHGPAGSPDPDRWPSDDQRPLTPRGVERTRLAAQGLSSLIEDVDLIYTSPLKRADETARILAEVFDREGPERTDVLSPGTPPRRVVEFLSKLDPEQTVVLVGHEPDLGMLVGVLVFGAPAALRIKKAGACSIAFDDTVGAGKGRLEWFLAPRILRRLAEAAPADRKSGV